MSNKMDQLDLMDSNEFRKYRKYMIYLFQRQNEMKIDTKTQFKPKIKLQIGDGYKFVDGVVKKNNLHTVCEEARCPNIYECWDRALQQL